MTDIPENSLSTARGAHCLPDAQFRTTFTRRLHVFASALFPFSEVIPCFLQRQSVSPPVVVRTASTKHLAPLNARKTVTNTECMSARTTGTEGQRQNTYPTSPTPAIFIPTEQSNATAFVQCMENLRAPLQRRYVGISHSQQMRRRHLLYYIKMLTYYIQTKIYFTVRIGR